MKKGVVYKFLGSKGLIRPDEFHLSRKDVIFEKISGIKVGDRVEYMYEERNGRRYAIELKKINGR